MAIRRMISRDGSFRDFQAGMIVLGKIRTGIYATPAGKRGRPEKLDRFRFTSPDEALIRAVADEYGGDVRPWSPERDPKRKEFEVITDTAELEVLILNGQRIDSTYEAWAAGRTCIRRCDGEWDVISQAPCLCTGPDKPSNPQDLCKITTRVQVMLQRIAGVGSWMYESHGENFATETSGLMAELVARAAVPVPSLLRLELETRRERNHAKGAFETKSFYVARFRTTAATPQQAITGGDVLTQALTGAPVRAVAATAYNPDGPQALQQFAQDGPAGQNAPTVPAGAPVRTIEALRPVILADIESRTTVAALEEVRDKLIARGIDDQQVREAWRSKMNAVVAAAKAGRVPCLDLYCANDPDTACGFTPDQHMAHHGAAAIVEADRAAGRVPERPYRVLVTGSRTWTDAETLNAALDVELAAHPDMVLVHGDCSSGGDAQAKAWAKRNSVPHEPHPADWNGPDGKGAGFARNLVMVASGIDRVFSFNRGGSKGTEHCTAAAEAAGLDVVRYTDDTPVVPPTEHRVGDTVTVGGIEFTKIREMPSIEDMLFKAQSVEGAVEAVPGAAVLPDVPDGDYDADEVYSAIMTGASKQTPPLTTSEVNRLITRTYGVDYVSQVDGHELARLRAGLKAGAVSWR